mgnify:CR=1 FL=1
MTHLNAVFANFPTTANPEARLVIDPFVQRGAQLQDLISRTMCSCSDAGAKDELNGEHANIKRLHLAYGALKMRTFSSPKPKPKPSLTLTITITITITTTITITITITITCIQQHVRRWEMHGTLSPTRDQEATMHLCLHACAQVGDAWCPHLRDKEAGGAGQHCPGSHHHIQLPHTRLLTGRS